MDSLIALGSGASLVYGTYALYKIAFGLGHGDIAWCISFPTTCTLRVQARS